MPKKRCKNCRRRRLRFPWLWLVAIPLSLLQLYAFYANWEFAVYSLSLPVILMWLGCCCGGGCINCCNENPITSTAVEFRIPGVLGHTPPFFNCGSNADCANLHAWNGMEPGSAPGFAGACEWNAPTTCGSGIVTYGTENGATLLLWQKQMDCDGVITSASVCYLTLILTGNSQFSGSPPGGDWIAIFELAIPGPYPVACEGLFYLPFKCQGPEENMPCDFDQASPLVAEVNIVSL